MASPDGNIGRIYIIREELQTYLCSAKAPVLGGSETRRLYPRKGTSLGRVYVCLLHVSIVGFFTIHKKRIRGGSTYAECNSGSLKDRRLQL